MSTDTPSTTAMMRSRTEEPCDCGYAGPHWEGDNRCAHCGGVRQYRAGTGAAADDAATASAAVNPYPRQLSDARLAEQFAALRAVTAPTLADLVDLSATVSEVIRRKTSDDAAITDEQRRAFAADRAMIADAERDGLL